MQKRKWSLNALSVELGIDRRTLAKRLQNVSPVSVEGRVKFYALDQVLARLDGDLRQAQLRERAAMNFDQDREAFERFLLPGVFNQAAPLLAAYFHKELGLSKTDALACYIAVWAIVKMGVKGLYRDLGAELGLQREPAIEDPAYLMSMFYDSPDGPFLDLVRFAREEWPDR